MSIEIKQLLIKSNIVQKTGNEALELSEEHRLLKEEMLAECRRLIKEEMLAECRRLIIDILQEKGER